MDSSPAGPTLDPGLAGMEARPVDGVDNGFVAGYRVRFDEAGPDGSLRTSGLLRYAQDIAWRHSESLGFGRAWYRDRGLGWVVRALELEQRAPVPLGTTLRVATAVVGHRRVWARRLAECHFADGRLAARVITDWVLLDARNRIIRIPDDFGVAFANPEERSEIIRVPAASGVPRARHELAVRPSDIDPLDHVNNAVYVDWLEEAVEASNGGRRRSAGAASAVPGGPDRQGGVQEAGSRTLRLEYVASAGPGDRVAVELFGPAAAWRARISLADGTELVRAALAVSAA